MSFLKEITSDPPQNDCTALRTSDAFCSKIGRGGGCS